MIFVGVTPFDTLANVKAWLKITDTSQDVLIAAFMQAASDAIANHCQRDPNSAARTETRDGNGKTEMILVHTPITAVSSVVIGTTTVLPSVNGGAGYVFDTSSIRLIGRCFDKGFANVALGYTAGFPTMPEAAKIAMAVTVQSIISSQNLDPNVVSESVPGVYSVSYRQDQPNQGVMLPAAVKMMLIGLARSMAIVV